MVSLASPRSVRKNILESSHKSGHGHIPTSFSIIEMVLATYGIMNHNPNEPEDPNRDIFILSKGHAALGYYCCLAELGYFDPKIVHSFGGAGTIFGCHPDRVKQPWVEVSCGSLGHGIGVGTGIALAQKINNTNRQVYCLIGDGESNEGTVWEAVMVAVGQKLDNLTILYDNNQSQSRCLQIRKPAEIFSAFGCEVHEVNGNDIDELQKVLSLPVKGRPKCIVANTIKGYGCRTLVNDVFAWHRRSPNEQELNQLLEELNA